MLRAVATLPHPAGWLTTVPPLPIDRARAAEEARRELSKHVYAAARPSLLHRIITDVFRWLQREFERVQSVAPGRGLGIIVFAGVLIVVALFMLYRFGPLRRNELFDSPIRRRGGPQRSAAEWRAAAERAAADGEWAEAIRSRMRAIARCLEERALIEVRPGRTARELAVEGGRALPAADAPLRAAAAAFDEVWYGGRRGTRERYALVVAADAAIREARPPADALAGSGAGWGAVP
jgi:hypothetical protein